MYPKMLDFQNISKKDKIKEGHWEQLFKFHEF